MICISNADRDKVVEYLRAYACILQRQGTHSTRTVNVRRMTLNLANKLERKQASQSQTIKQPEFIK